MNDVTPLLPKTSNPKARLGIFLSGSGSNAERILEMARAAGAKAPFEVAVLVTDAPESSRARELGQTYGLPVLENDIRQFYRQRGQTRVSIASEAGQQVREDWTNDLRAQLAPYRLDFGVLAGFVPLTNLVGDFPCLNVHPGDLTYLKGGHRYLVGLHTVPIERAILEGLDYLRSSVILAEPYSGQGEDMDSGPLLGISPEVPIDFQETGPDSLAACLAARPPKRPKGGYADRLEQLAALNQDLLKEQGDWVVFPRVVADFANNRYGLDAGGKLCYRFGCKWLPIETVIYGNGDKEVIFRAE